MSEPPAADEPGTEPASTATRAADEQKKIVANSAVMAAGTLVSRFSGFFRGTLLAAALGASLQADVFTVANTVPNMLYILLAGGVFNAVLVPQLVRAMKNDADGGSAYVDRVVTLAVLFLGAVTIALVVAAPAVMDVMMSEKLLEPEFAAQKQSAIDLARFCLPQVFFYGVFVLVGQILNARGRFGPMMWAPIANNVISIAVLVVYLFVFGPAADPDGALTPGREALLGIGSTLGIVAQFLILVPYLRAAGVRIRPRFDFRNTGLGATLRLAIWTVLFVIVNQVAYVVVVRLASGGAAEQGTGIFVYSSAMLVVMVPHSVVTVSLATAILPRLSRHAADGELPSLARTLTGTIRVALVVAVPIAFLLPVVADDVSQVVWGHGATSDSWDLFAPTVALFGVGIVFFTIHHLVLRGFYALELNRTVFLIQCVVATVNIATALVLVPRVDPEHTAPALVIAYTCAYAVGSLISFTVLNRRLSGGQAAPMVRYAVRLLLATGLAAAVAWGLSFPLRELLELAPGWGAWPWAFVEGVVLAIVHVLAFLVFARLVRLTEVTEIVGTFARRLRR